MKSLSNIYNFLKCSFHSVIPLPLLFARSANKSNQRQFPSSKSHPLNPIPKLSGQTTTHIGVNSTASSNRPVDLSSKHSPIAYLTLSVHFYSSSPLLRYYRTYRRPHFITRRIQRKISKIVHTI